ncbi:hypothetical protein [Streptomyces sp. NPDC056049]|uniref:hypothetical protein n=1 Tax=Streptomyces sp. NPDC056049 TaxID=3345693 RepID=UPI0035DA5519
MGDSVAVHCPECRRSHTYAAPVYPCPCGSPVAPRLVPDATAEPVRHRTWLDEWVTVRCRACGREDQWPSPELGCACGAVLRIPVAPVTEEAVGAGTATPVPEGERDEGYGSERHGPPAHAADDSAGPGPDTAPAGFLAAPEGRAGDEGAEGAEGEETEHATGRHEEGRHEEGWDGDGWVGEAGDEEAGDEQGLEAATWELPRQEDPEEAPEETRQDDPASEGLPDGTAPTADGSPGDTAPTAPVTDWFGNTPRSFAERYPVHIPLPPTAPRPAPARGAFRPVTIRTASDAVAAAATYLRWLGFREIVQPDDRHSAGVDLRGPGLVAQVDPSTRPAGLRAVECLWLNGLNTSAVGIFFSLAGYTPEARSRATEIGLPLFVLDLTGTPQPVNNAADELTSGGAI